MCNPSGIPSFSKTIGSTLTVDHKSIIRYQGLVYNREIVPSLLLYIAVDSNSLSGAAFY